MPTWEALTYFHQLAAPNAAVIEAELGSAPGAPDGAAVCYAQTAETLAADGAYVSCSVPYQGPGLWLGLTSADAPVCAGSPCVFAHAFEAGLAFDGDQCQVQKSGVNQGASFTYAANDTFLFTRVNATTVTVQQNGVLRATLTYGAPLAALRLAVVAGSTAADEEGLVTVTWEHTTYFSIAGGTATAQLETAYNVSGATNGHAVCWAQTAEQLVNPGDYFEFTQPNSGGPGNGPELFVGLTTQNDPACVPTTLYAGTPDEFSYCYFNFDPEYFFYSDDAYLEAVAQGVTLAPDLTITPTTVLRFTKVDADTLTFSVNGSVVATYNAPSPLPALRLCALAGSTGGADDTVQPQVSAQTLGAGVLQPRVRLKLYGAGGGPAPVNYCGEDAPRLLIVGQLEPEVARGFARLEFDLGRGHTPSVLVGHSGGGRFYKYVFKALPDRPGDANFVLNDPEAGGASKTWAEYLPAFFRRRMNDCLPFKVVDQRTGEDVCVVFAPEQRDELNLRLIGRDVYACEIRLEAFRDVAD